MAGPAELDFVTGVAVGVSFSTETAVASDRPRAIGRRGGGLADEIINVMHLTLRDSGGKTQEFAFRNTTVHVREGHDIAIVRARRAGLKAPLVLMLVNRSNGQRDEFSDGLRRAASQKGWRARWRALIGAACVALLTSPIAHFIVFSGANAAAALGVTLAAGGVAFVALWGGFALSDQVRLPARDRAEVQRLRAEVKAQLFAPPAPLSAPATADQTGRERAH